MDEQEDMFLDITIGNMQTPDSTSVNGTIGIGNPGEHTKKPTTEKEKSNYLIMLEILASIAGLPTILEMPQSSTFTIKIQKQKNSQ